MTYKTANGRNFDMQSLMMKNDREIAVGNSSTNARGDQLGPGGKVLRTKEELTKSFYTRQVGSRLTDLPSEQTKAPDPFQVQADLPVDQADWAPEPEVTTPLPPDLADARANALAQSQLLAERIRQQRQKEADDKKQG